MSKATLKVMSPAVCTVLTTKAARDCFIAAKFGDPHGNGAADCTTAMASGLPKEITGRVLVDRGVIYLAHKSDALALKETSTRPSRRMRRSATPPPTAGRRSWR